MLKSKKLCALVLCIVLILNLVGCGSGTSTPLTPIVPKPSENSETNPTTLYVQDPRDAIEQYYYFFSVGDAQGVLRSIGVEWEDEYEHHYENWVRPYIGMKYEIGKISLVKKTGMEYENAERKIVTYWLNNEDLAFKSLYTVFDIQEIGRAYWHMHVQVESEDFEDDVESYVVKTDLGWFVVPEEYLEEK